MKKLSGLSALVSPRVLLGVGLVAATSLFGGTGCGLSYSLTGLYVEPATGDTCLYPGSTAQFTAFGTYTEGGHTMRVTNISSEVNWSVTIPDLATISSSGLATAGTNFVGVTSIVATTQGEFGYLSSSSSLQVSTSCTTSALAKPFSLHIVPGNQSLTVGQTLQPLAIASYPGTGRSTDISGQVTWSSSNNQVATIDAHGVISAVAAGDAVITAEAKAPDGEIVRATQNLHFQPAQ